MKKLFSIVYNYKIEPFFERNKSEFSKIRFVENVINLIETFSLI